MRANRKSVRIRETRGLVAFILLFFPIAGNAGDILDYIRNYDLNDYALGLAVSVSQNPYTTAANSVIAYPFLSSFRDASFTDDWLLISDGELGVRKVTKSGWVLGVAGRLQTRGLGSELTDELLGLDEKLWGIEAGPFINFRRWPVHFTVKSFKEISGRHGGWSNEVSASLPGEFSWGYLVPVVAWQYLDDTYTDYYYQVSPAEARPGRPPYEPGPANNYSAALRWGYQLSENWQLTGKIKYEVLDDEIRNSPIVDKDNLWSGNIGIAYNADVFQTREYGPDTKRLPKFEVRVGLFQDNIDTKILRNDQNGNIGEVIDVEELFAASDNKSVLQLDAIWRINPYNRIELGYFGLNRDSEVALERDLRIGTEIFAEGVNATARTSIRVIRAAYAFSLMNDAQKELGVMAGIHVTDVDAEFFASETRQRAEATATAPLPVAGLHGSVALGQKTTLGARLQFFKMQFDQYDGQMTYFTLTLQYMFAKKGSVGLGFNFYELKLDSDIPEINGTLEVRHHGPYVFLGAHF